MGYSTAQAKEFIKYIAPMIQKEAKARGYHTCAAVIAQAVIEGAAGTSGLAKYHNHFGLKCGSSWKGKSVNMRTKEEYSGQLMTIKDNFRVYNSDEECVAGYYIFISTQRYANLKTASNYKVYASYLKQDGYATSSTYVNTLCSTVAKYGLDRYDDVLQSESSYYPKYTGNSERIDEVFRSIGVDEKYIGNYKARKPIALANGLVGYTGQAESNKLLIDLAKQGLLKVI